MGYDEKLFEPDILAGDQFRATHHSSGVGMLGGERGLMLAVLQDALECFRKYAYSSDFHGRVLYGEARDWIESRDRNWFFSYESICETLGLDPNYLRKGLTHWLLRSIPKPRQTSSLDQPYTSSA